MDLEMPFEKLPSNIIAQNEKLLLKQQFEKEKWVVLLID